MKQHVVGRVTLGEGLPTFLAFTASLYCATGTLREAAYSEFARTPLHSRSAGGSSAPCSLSIWQRQSSTVLQVFPLQLHMLSQKGGCSSRSSRLLALLALFHTFCAVAGGAGPAEVLSLPTGSNYIYVYDMPQRFTQDILAMPLDQS